MKVKTQTSLKFTGAHFINVKFRSVRMSKADVEATLDISPKVFFPKGKPTQFIILIEVRIAEEKGAFTLEVDAIGNFHTPKNITKANRDQFINANAPAILFPYVRAFVSTLTSNLGDKFQPVLLPTQFFKGVIPIVDKLIK